MVASSTVRLGTADLERLLARFPLPHASGLQLRCENGRLRVHVAEVQLPAPLLPPFPATFEVKAALVEGQRNVVAVHLQAERLPMGLQLVANPFMDKVLEWMLPEGAGAYVQVRSPSLLWLHLEAVPDYGRPFAEALTLTRLTVPGASGAALEATFGVRPA